MTDSWNTAHPEKMAEATKRYRVAHPEKIRAANKKRNRRFLRYGITYEEFVRMLDRQHRKCMCCLEDINEKTANVDHRHDDSKFVRGLLCRNCNWALGNVKDNTMTLRRLMAYVDYDRTKTHIYLAGSLRNPRIPEIGNLLRSAGFDVMDEWCTPGELADDNWQKYEKLRGRSYAEALRGRGPQNIFSFDRAYLDFSDIVIAAAPFGKSAMIELGYAKGRGKRVYIFLDGNEPERFEVMPNFVDKLFSSEEEMLKELQLLKENYQ